MPEEENKERLFFALWPDPGLQEALAGKARETLGRRRARLTPAANLHITLAFLGETGAEARACAERVAGGLDGEPFTLVLDRLGYWGRRGLLWAGPNTVPAPLADLAEELGRALEDCGFERERRPFRPHLTLARKAPKLPSRMALDPLEWPVERFVLVASRLGPGGPEYGIVGEWPLGRAPDSAAP